MLLASFASIFAMLSVAVRVVICVLAILCMLKYLKS